MSRVNHILAQFELWLETIANQIFSIWNRHKVGILGTIALNLLIAILFFVFQLRSRPHLHDTMVVLDFNREYEIVQEKEPEAAQPVLPRDAIDPKFEGEAIRNFAVDATKEDLNPGLTDEKNLDADELYRDAQRIREQMQQNRDLWEAAQNIEAVDIPNTKEKLIPDNEIGQFKGPTVISYYLEERKAWRLPVPAYKCERGGQVVVEIEVQRDGKVIKATIDRNNSVIDECMNNAAQEAAKESIFSPSETAPAKQKGSITYLFVPQ
jgi:TonB family protein